VLSELKSIYGCIHFNFLIVIKYILTQYNTNNIKENGIRRTLLRAIEVGLSENISAKDMKEHYLMKLLKYNVDSIILGYKNIVDQCYLVPRCSVSNINLKKRNDIEQEYINGIISRFFIDAFNNIEEFSFEQYNSILNEKILKKENKACISNNNLLQIETHSEANESNNTNNITPHFQNNNVYNSRYSFGNKNNLNNSNNSIANKVSATHKKSQSETPITKYNINNEDDTNNKSKYTLQYSSRLSFNSESPFIIPSSNNNTNSHRQLNTGCLSTPIYYLPPISPTFKFTLVLDLDETLLHVTKINNKLSLYNNSSTTVKVIYRPHLFSFLSRMKKIYEIILFTVSLPEYANKIINLIENKEKYFSYKLFRQHATFYQNKDYVKDISKLGRDLKRVIIVDDMPQNFSLQKENGISVKPFYGDNTNDMTLSKLGSILERIRFDNEDVKGSEEIDVRKSIRKYKDKLNELVN
jgi:Dullard-like phosphatase family protein